MAKVEAKKASNAFFSIKKQVGRKGNKLARRKMRGTNEITSAYPFKSKSKEPLSFISSEDRLNSFCIKKERRMALCQRIFNIASGYSS